jgi:apolipoprotein N-acyltransferase
LADVKTSADISPAEGRRDPAPRAGRSLPLAALAGVALWLACPPVGAWPVAWVALGPLSLAVLRARGPFHAAWRGYVFGLVYFGAVLYWIGLTVCKWTGSPIGWLAWAAMTAIVPCFYVLWACVSWLATRRMRPGWQMITLASLWVVMERLRTAGDFSLPWAQVSCTQYRCLPVIRIASLFGAYGVSFLVVLVGASIAVAIEARKRNRPWRFPAIAIGLTVACILAFALPRPERTGERPIRVALMQPNFDPFDRTEDPTAEMATIDDLMRQMAAPPGPLPDLVVWPESAAPGDAVHDRSVREHLQALADGYRACLLIGSRVVDRDNGHEFNSSVLFTPGRTDVQEYDKRQLVPFGEYTPFKGLLPAALLDSFHTFDQDATRGTRSDPMVCSDASGRELRIGAFICYEAIYPQYTCAYSAAGANLLVTQSNDAWYRSTAMKEEHLAAVVLRAVETGRPIARSTVSGITCGVDATGRIQALVPENRPGFALFDARVSPNGSLYARYPDWFVVVCAVLVCAGIAIARLNPEPPNGVAADERSSGRRKERKR